MSTELHRSVPLPPASDGTTADTFREHLGVCYPVIDDRRSSRAVAVGIGAGVTAFAAGTVRGWPLGESIAMGLALFAVLAALAYVFYVPE